MAARWLVTLDELSEAFRWTVDRWELASELWVTCQVLSVRLRHLHPAERAKIRAATEHHRDMA